MTVRITQANLVVTKSSLKFNKMLRNQLKLESNESIIFTLLATRIRFSQAKKVSIGRIWAIEQ